MTRPFGPYRSCTESSAHEDIAPEELVEGGTSLPAHGSGKIVGPELVAQDGVGHETRVEGHRMLGLRDPVLADEEQDARSCQGEPDRGVTAKRRTSRGGAIDSARRGAGGKGGRARRRSAGL